DASYPAMESTIQSLKDNPQIPQVLKDSMDIAIQSKSLKGLQATVFQAQKSIENAQREERLTQMHKDILNLGQQRLQIAQQMLKLHQADDLKGLQFQMGELHKRR